MAILVKNGDFSYPLAIDVRAIFFHSTCIDVLEGRLRRNFVIIFRKAKTRMVELPEGEKSLRKCLAVLIQLTSDNIVTLKSR